MAMAEVAKDHKAVDAAAVDPPLTPDNAAGRHVFVLASEFGAEGIGGWVARCRTRPAQSPACSTILSTSPPLPCSAVLTCAPLVPQDYAGEARQTAGNQGRFQGPWED